MWFINTWNRGKVAMEVLTVDTEGGLFIPPEITNTLGFGPGDSVVIVKTAEGVLIRLGGVDSKTLEWWNSLSEEDRRVAREEAQKYEALSEEERDAIWNEFDDSIEEEAEGDEIDLSTFQRAVR
jgi:bifunctional DNA-binding transcriptional regulator/antitoxin component of YhaV-PrlF toxin-antitoxin module